MSGSASAASARAREVERDDALPRIEIRWNDGGPVAGIALKPLDFGRSTDTPVARVESAWRALAERWRDRFHTVVGASQVHGARLFVADGLAVPGDAGPTAPRLLRVAGYDGFVSAEPGVMATVGIADCVPAVLWAPEARTLALLHAGWRGVAAEIVPRAVAAMESIHGVEPGGLRAWWGPAIGPCHYPVGDEVVEAIAATSAGPETDAWLRGGDEEARPDDRGRFDEEGAPRVDLRAALTRQARAAGVPEEAIAVSPHCTACDPDRFHSYRREEGGGGRMVAFAGIPLAGRG